MKEIPKDGKSYLCWRKGWGHHFVHWRESFKCYVSSMVQEDFFNLNGCIDRYMDEKGKWHELDTDTNHENSDMKSSQKMIWYSVHDIIKNDDQWWPAPQATLCRSMEEALECQKHYKSSKITKMVIDEVTQQFVPYEEDLIV